jgi:hypothetical protein
MEIGQVIEQAMGVLLGGIITWLVSRYYYKRAANELCQEAAKLREETIEIRRLTNIILRGLHNAGICEVKWQDGNPVGLVIKLRTKIDVKSSTSNINLTVE